MFFGQQGFNLKLIIVIALMVLIKPKSFAFLNFNTRLKPSVNYNSFGAQAVFSNSFSHDLTSVTGYGDGMLYLPHSVVTDSQKNIYVSDTQTSRILKYAPDGSFLGWIGGVQVTPKGGAFGCTSVSYGGYTPGWCIGGRSIYGSEDGMFSSPKGLAIDASDNLYIVDSGNHRIMKYNSLGVYQGWTGAVSILPTGGSVGCLAASSLTPGWCLGGYSTSSSTSGSGGFNSPTGIAVDSSGNLYITDTFNNRMVKYNASGSYVGWVGAIASGGSPNGGDAGCAGATVLTPGWCTGGTTTNGSSTGNGGMYRPYGIATASGTILVTDTYYRVLNYTTSGTFVGWVGRISSKTSMTCTSGTPVVGSATPSFCKNGASAAAIGNGMMGTAPKGVALSSDASLFFVGDSSNKRILKYTINGVFQGWLGKIATMPTGGDSNCTNNSVGNFTSGWCLGGTAATGSNLDGMINTGSNALTVDSDGAIYLADTSNYRLNKYSSAGLSLGALANQKQYFTWGKYNNLVNGSADGMFTSAASDLTVDSNGTIYTLMSASLSRYNSSSVFTGWIGGISTAPTGGDAGCTTVGTGVATPGWCLGGAANWGTSDGQMNSPQGIASDSLGNLYIADYGNHRILRYNTAGVFTGWIGAINTSPTGGDTGCSGATGVTPGWCLGGDSTTGSGDGQLSYPYGLTFDSANNLYVADAGNNRIVKYNINGVFQGWIGNIATQPTGGTAGCTTAAVNSVTPGWCTGGSAQAAPSGFYDGDGSLKYPKRIVIDSSNNIYVASQIMITRYNSLGAFTGWIGGINTSPTGGDTGCNGATGVTPGWCLGGTAANAVSALASEGSFNNIVGLAIDARGNLIIADPGLFRIVKHDSNGKFVGWIGKVNVSPTGGDTGCNGATSGTFTPGWCKGGSSQSNVASGYELFDGLGSIFVHANGDLYVVQYTGITRISGLIN